MWLSSLAFKALGTRHCPQKSSSNVGLSCFVPHSDSFDNYQTISYSPASLTIGIDPYDYSVIMFLELARPFLKALKVALSMRYNWLMSLPPRALTYAAQKSLNMEKPSFID
jgi:hypothetical protein